MTGSDSWAPAPGWGRVDRPDEVDHGGRLYVAPLATGPVTVLHGPSAIVARAALAGHDLTSIRGVLCEVLAVSTDDVDDAALMELLADLVRLGLLQQRPSP